MLLFNHWKLETHSVNEEMKQIRSEDRSKFMFHKLNSTSSKLNDNVNRVYTMWDNNTARQTNTDHPLLYAEAEKTKFSLR